MSPSTSERRVEKGTLSTYLRTTCEKELYLSLHPDKILEKYSLPVPLKARPGVGILRDAGVDFEEKCNQQLRRAFGAYVIERGVAGVATDDLHVLLSNVARTPSFLLQGKFAPESFRKELLSNLGLDTATAALIPPLAGMIPDVVIVREWREADEEVLPDGTRRALDSSDGRRVLSVIDVKHTSEPNTSYSAEVALYTFLLSNWIRAVGVETRYAVTSRSMLWTRSSVGSSKLLSLLDGGGSPSNDELLEALIKDCDPIQFSFFMQTVRRFFAEDLPGVVKTGDADWTKLDWHVAPKCSSCDWLGIGRWLDADDRAKVAAHPDHYCVPHAEQIEHPSRVCGITNGARKTLMAEGISTTTHIAGSSGTELVYKGHSLLKRERRKIPQRARALHSGVLERDTSVLVATLAREPHLQVNVTINFDSSAGLLTGLALTGRVGFPYRAGGSPSPVKLSAQPFIVESMSHDDEWAALEGFLDHLASYISRAETEFQSNGYGGSTITSQIAFWERRQYAELCGALGRHLPKVFALSNRKAKALAWLFPADELLEREDGAISPCVVFIEEIIKRAVFPPIAHTWTLYDTAEHYHYGTTRPWIPDSFYREFLSNGIPRERIYEIWSGAKTVVRAGKSIPRLTLTHEFSNALLAQSRALDSVVIRLRIDFKDQLKGNAATINTSIPRGANVAFDGKLWVWWDRLEKATANINAHTLLAESPEVLEASFQAIRLTRLKGILPNGHRVYEVNPDSTEAKLDDGDNYLAIGMESIPGLPLSKAKRYVPAGAPSYTGDPLSLTMPMWAVIKVRLISFDRDNLEATIALDVSDPNFLPYLAANAGMDFSNEVYISPSKISYDSSVITKSILEEIGNPSIATPDPNAANAMGMKLGKAGSDPVKPASRVLWDAPSLQALQKRPAPEADKIANDAQSLHSLNDSQAQAVKRAAERLLTIIWGPPGTGKTKTLVALIHALIRDAVSAKRKLKILITGPTYKAVEELVGRLITKVEADPSSLCDIFVAYSRSRVPAPYASGSPHLRVSSFNLYRSAPEWALCSSSLDDNQRVSIVATTCHQAHKLSEYKSGQKVSPLFDLVVLDESSQVPVPRALGPLAVLETDGQVVVAGDHLQMPPIQELEAPKGAEYLVGSIQTYLLKRPFSSPVYTCDLLENYRSSKHLVDFAKTIGYPAGLTAKFPDTSLEPLTSVASLKGTLPAALPWSDGWPNLLDPKKSTVALLYEDEVSSQSNAYEARIVVALTYLLRNAFSKELSGRGAVTHGLPDPDEFWGRCLGIVTPHRAQRALVTRELRKAFPSDPANELADAVDTVEKFQGGERHVIIVSFGVGDPDVIAGEEAFLMQLERTNVAISRAMAKCVVIMPKSLASHVPEQKKALETAHALKGFVDEFCNVSSNIIIGSGVNERQGQIRWHK